MLEIAPRHNDQSLKQYVFATLSQNIVRLKMCIRDRFGKAIIQYSKLLFGLAIVENAYDDTYICLLYTSRPARAGK